ncbi:hypothetical protein ES702_07478 [subsurface metagenome]
MIFYFPRTYKRGSELPHKDIEKKRVAQRKYAKSKKGRAATQRYLETHKSELAKKREEGREKKLQAFCRWYNRDYWIIKRLITLHENGVDIEARDPWNAKYVFKWLRKLSEEEKKKRKEERKKPSVRSSDYY